MIRIITAPLAAAAIAAGALAFANAAQAGYSDCVYRQYVKLKKLDASAGDDFLSATAQAICARRRK